MFPVCTTLFPFYWVGQLVCSGLSVNMLWKNTNKNLTNNPLHACMHAQSYPTLCDPMDCSRPGSSAHGIFQARILEWVTISSSKGIFPTQGLPALAGRFFSAEPPGKPYCAYDEIQRQVNKGQFLSSRNFKFSERNRHAKQKMTVETLR